MLNRFAIKLLSSGRTTFIIKILSQCGILLQCQYIYPSILNPFDPLIDKPWYWMLSTSLKGTINFVYSKQVDHLSRLKRRSLLNLLENKLTKHSFLTLGFLISMSQAIYKTCLLLPYYVILVVASWNWRSTTKESNLLHLAAHVSQFIVSIKALLQTNN